MANPKAKMRKKIKEEKELFVFMVMPSIFMVVVLAVYPIAAFRIDAEPNS